MFSNYYPSGGYYPSLVDNYLNNPFQYHGMEASSAGIAFPEPQLMQQPSDIEVNYPDAEVNFDSPFRPAEAYPSVNNWQLVQNLQHQAAKDAEHIIVLQVQLREKDGVIEVLRNALQTLNQRQLQIQTSVLGSPQKFFEPISEASSETSEIEFPLHQESSADTPSTEIPEERMDESASEKSSGKRTDSSDASSHDSEPESVHEITVEATHAAEVAAENDVREAEDEGRELDPVTFVKRTADAPNEKADNPEEQKESPEADDAPPTVIAPTTSSPSEFEDLVHKDFTDPSLPTKPDPDRKIFEVEAVYGSLISSKKGELWFLVKWRNYPLEDCSWEPKSNLHTVKEAVLRFFEVNGKPSTSVPKILDANGRRYEADQLQKHATEKVNSRRVGAVELLGFKKPKISPKKRKSTPRIVNPKTVSKKARAN